MALLELEEEGSPKLVEKSGSFHEGDAADQLVYQLVRSAGEWSVVYNFSRFESFNLEKVEEDGTVVPASEDEVIEMESFLEGGTAIQVSNAEGTQMDMKNEEGMVCEREDSFGSKDKSAVGSQHLDGLEAERKKLLAQLAFLDALLQKLKDEEQERASSEGVDAVAGYSELIKRHGDHHVKQQISGFMDLDGKWDCKSDTNIMSSDISDDPCQKQTVSVEQIANSRANLRELESPSSTSKHNWTNISNGSSFRDNLVQISFADDKREASKDSDYDLFKGNVSLDKLSIRELHEAFRTTFGRQTSVKDKQWLKRRISMGLGGSLETTSAEGASDASPMFAIADDAPGFMRPGTSPPEDQALCVPETGQVAGNKSPEAAFSFLVDSKPLEHKKIAGNRSPEEAFSSLVDPKFLEHKKRSPRVAHQFTITGESENFEKNDDVQLSRDEGKRKRKPTKRYIEELAASDTREVIGKVAAAGAAAKDSSQEKTELNIVNKAHSKDQGKQTAAGNMGISEVKFRTGYRRRRGRPRKSGNMFPTSNSSERAAQLVRKAISVRTSRLSGKSALTEPRVKIKPLPNDTMDVAPQSSITPPRHNAEPISNLPDLKSSEADTDTILSGKGGSQKKHHHPWTLREVIKLLEGVTHCGVGKWADIKKFSFSNCVYRSSTDLKDKWRNLVRASNSHYKMMSQQGEHRRKHSASPVPGPILIQVYELAAQRGQPSSANSDSGISRSGRIVPKRHLI